MGLLLNYFIDKISVIKHLKIAEELRIIRTEREFQQALKQTIEAQRPRLADLDRKVPPPKMEASQDELLQAYGASVWVYAAMNVISEKLSSVQWRVIDEGGDVHESFLDTDRPNPLMSWNDLRATTQLHLDSTGNGYWWHIETPEGEHEFFPLRPSRTQPVPSKDGRSIVGYAYKPDGIFKPKSNGSTSQSPLWNISAPAAAEKMSHAEFTAKQVESWSDFVRYGRAAKAVDDKSYIPLPAESVIHFRYPHPYSDYYGMSPLQPLLLSLTTEMYARSWNKRFFENGAIPEGVIVFPSEIGEEEFKELQKQFIKQHGGVENAWKPFILQSGADYRPFSNQHRDVEFLDLLRMSREDTLGVFNVPPVMVGVYTFSSGGNRSAGAAEQRQSFWEDTIIPKSWIWRDALNSKLDFGEGLHLEFDYSSVDALMPNYIKIAAGAKNAIMGGLTLDEARELFYGLKPATEPVLMPNGTIHMPDGSLVSSSVNDEGEDGLTQEQIYLPKKKQAPAFPFGARSSNKLKT